MMNDELFSYVILPLLIFLARVTDVSMDTIRIIFVSKGLRKLAPLIGFFQVLIWIITLTNLVQNMDNWITYVAYAGGFATGNFVGMIIEEKLAIGFELIRVITKREAHELLAVLRENGFGVTSVDAKGSSGDVAVIYIITRRSRMHEIIHLIKTYNPKALYTIEDIRFVSSEIYFKNIPERKRRFQLRGV
ncbi:MAG: DUF2179 domain-containing protein [Bacteroidota bacterium]